jgi:hypothetical protein
MAAFASGWCWGTATFDRPLGVRTGTLDAVLIVGVFEFQSLYRQSKIHSSKKRMDSP